MSKKRVLCISTKILFMAAGHAAPHIDWTALFERPRAPPLGGTVRFQLHSLTYDYAPRQRELPMRTNLPVVRLAGRTADGFSVALTVHGFAPYGLMASSEALLGYSGDQLKRELQAQLDAFVADQDPEARTMRIVGVHHEQHYDTQGYQHGRRRHMLRVDFSSPSEVSRFREFVQAHQPEGVLRRTYKNDGAVTPAMLEAANIARDAGLVRQDPEDRVPAGRDADVPAQVGRRLRCGRPLQVFGHQVEAVVWECNVPFALRFLIDHGLRPMQWAELQTYGELDRMTSPYTDTVDYHLYAHHEHVLPLALEGEYGKMAPMRLLSFDIESACHHVIMVCLTLCDTSFVKAPWHLHTVCLHLGTMSPMPSPRHHAYQCASVADMLREVRRLVQHFDADGWTGWNIDGYDVPELVRNAAAAGLGPLEFGELGRLKGEPIKLTADTFENNTRGPMAIYNSEIRLRMPFDAIRIFMAEMKERYNNLAYITSVVFKDVPEAERPAKGDVSYAEIEPLFLGSADDRLRLAVYCARDAELPYMNLERKGFFAIYCGMSRLTGVPLQWLIERGASAKVLISLIIYSRKNDTRVRTPYYTPRDLARWELQLDKIEKYGGAIVIEPQRGYYTVPITTLDQTGLYPSVMRARNLSPDTLLTAAEAAQLRREHGVGAADYCRDTDTWTVSKKLHLGIVPGMLGELYDARMLAKANKSAAAKRGDKEGEARYEVEQLNCKLLMNSSYGVFGAHYGPLTCVPIAASTTAYGREVIMMDKRLVEGPMMRQLMIDYFRSPAGAELPLLDLQRTLRDLVAHLFKYTREAKRVEGDEFFPTQEIPSEAWCQLIKRLAAGEHAGPPPAADAEAEEPADDAPRKRQASANHARGEGGASPAEIIELILAVLAEAPSVATVIYGDTDSVMILLHGAHRVDVAVAVTKQAAKHITAVQHRYFGSEVEIAWEKLYYPYLLRGPKFYAGLMWTRIDRPDKEDCKGMESKQRGHAPALQRTQKALLTELMQMRGADAAFAHVAALHDRLLRDELPLSDYHINKGIKRDNDGYKAPDTQPHVWARRRLAAEGPEVPVPAVGQRMDFVIRYDPNVPSIAARATDPEQLQRYGERPDRLYYWTNKFLTPLAAVLDIVLGEGETARRLAQRRQFIKHTVGWGHAAPMPPAAGAGVDDDGVGLTATAWLRST
jgi:DNA polymerase elongation subunit (family B)